MSSVIRGRVNAPFASSRSPRRRTSRAEGSASLSKSSARSTVRSLSSPNLTEQTLMKVWSSNISRASSRSTLCPPKATAQLRIAVTLKPLTEPSLRASVALRRRIATTREPHPVANVALFHQNLRDVSSPRKALCDYPPPVHRFRSSIAGCPPANLNAENCPVLHALAVGCRARLKPLPLVFHLGVLFRLHA